MIIVASVPLLMCVGGMALLSLDVRRARVTAEKARSAVGIGVPLSDAVRSSSDPVGTVRFLQCYEARCVDPSEVILATRRGDRLTVLPADGSPSPSSETEEPHGQLLRLDRIRCNRAKITFCGRPWITFSLELDGAQRVTRVGPLTESAD